MTGETDVVSRARALRPTSGTSDERDGGSGREFLAGLDEALGAIAVPDAHDSFPAEALARLHAAGIMRASLPRERGGSGLCDPARADLLRQVLVRVGRANQVLGRLYEGHVNAHGLAFRFGDAAAKDRVVSDTEAGHVFGVWNAEPDQGGVELDAAAGVLRGRKIYASGAGFIGRPLVTATGQDGLSQMLIVPLEEGERADLGRWRARGMRASATGTVSFDDYPLARTIPVGRPDDYHEQPYFSGGAWRFLAVHQGGIEAVHAAHKAHLLRLGRHEDPHQLARLGRSAIATETARAFVARACAVVNGPAAADAASAVALVNLARAAVERAGLDVIELAQVSVGLSSMLEDHPLERLTRDLSVYLRQPGPDYALTSAARRLCEIEGRYLAEEPD